MNDVALYQYITHRIYTEYTKMIFYFSQKEKIKYVTVNNFHKSHHLQSRDLQNGSETKILIFTETRTKTFFAGIGTRTKNSDFTDSYFRVNQNPHIQFKFDRFLTKFILTICFMQSFRKS
jgi:hypothetical protein